MGNVSLKVLEKSLKSAQVFCSKRVRRLWGPLWGGSAQGGGGRGYLFRLQVYERVGVLQVK